MNKQILKIRSKELKEEISKMTNLVSSKMEEIESFIKNIPPKYSEIEIISNLRKEYYIKTFKIRFNEILKKSI